MSSNYWNWEQLYRDFWNRPIGYPFLIIYNVIMNIRRYDRMPFYFAPVGTKVVSFEDGLIKRLDFMLDAHEEPRNPADRNRNFYERCNYFFRNYFRWQNETLCNVMFDTKATRL
jgi:hypothetical protein